MSRALAHLLAVVLVLATAAPASLTPAVAEVPASSGRPVARVRLPFPHDDGSLTPYTFQLGHSLMTLVYDTLMWRDDEGTPQPWLARSVETSPDGRRIRIDLHPGARWHDGMPLTATDVAFTFAFVSERPHPRFTPELEAVERVEVADPATVVVTLRHPSPGFLDQPLADMPMLPAHLWKGLPRSEPAPGGLPVGSGPYRLVEHLAGERYRFEAVPDHFRGPPAVRVLEVPVIRTFPETLRALERREVDMLPVGLPEAALQDLEDPTARVRQGPSYEATVLVLNVRRPPFDQLEARRALASVIDANQVARALGSVTPATHGYLHPASPWAPPAPVAAPEGLTAAATLRQLPPTEVLVADGDPTQLEAARQVVLALRRAGAPAAVKPVAAAELDRRAGDPSGEGSFSAMIWTAPSLPSYDPDYLRAFFGSDPARAAFNFSGYRSDTFDAAAARVASLVDPVARRAAVSEELRILAEEVPAVPLFFGSGAFVYRPGVYDGWRFVKGAGLLDKRSFTEPFQAPSDGTQPDPVRGEPAREGRAPLRWAALGLAAAAVALAAGALFTMAVRR